MKRFLITLASALFLICFGLFVWLRPPAPAARQVFVNGVVLTMDAENHVVEAVALEGERIVAVGSNAQIRALIRRDTVVHDLHGQVLLPGFVDAHSHFPGAGLSVLGVDLNSPPIGPVRNLDDLLGALREKAKVTPKGKWVFGFGYDDTLLAEGRHPTREDLDRVSVEHPIYIWHSSGHMGVVNSKALEIVGINRDTPNPAGGIIVRDPETGEPTGLLQENALKGVQEKALNASAFDFLRMIRAANDAYLRAGVTTAQSGAVDFRMLKGLAFASRIGLVPMRLELWPLYDQLGLQLLDGSVDAVRFNTEKLHLGAIKMIADGSIQGFTGYLSRPYLTSPNGDPSYRGYPRIDRDSLRKWVLKYHRAGFQVAIHGNGDAAIDDIIDAFREAQAAYPRKDARPIIVHAQMVRSDQLNAMRELGMTPSFFSAHVYYWGDRHRKIFLGPERAARISPARSALNSGLHVSTHLDTPVVPMSPLFAVWSCVNRKTRSGFVLGPEERISVMEALRAVTIEAAWQIFREKELGSIEPGKLADLVVLDGNPLACPEAIKDIQVAQTIVGGVTVWRYTPD